MRILMVAQFFAPVIGGEERMVEAMSVGLAKRGHDVTVATLQVDGLAPREEYRGVEIRRIRSAAQRVSAVYEQAGRPHAMPAPDPGTLRGLLRVIEETQPDVIHGHNWLMHSLLPSKIKRAGGAPMVLSLHDYSLVCATKRLMRDGAPCSGPSPTKCMSCATQHYGSLKGAPTLLGVRVMEGVARANVDLFLPVSESVERHSGLSGDGRSVVLPNFVPDDLAKDSRRGKVQGLPDGPYILFAGDATTDKGIDVLLKAYAGLESAPPLVLIGRAESERLADPPPNVHVLGPRPHPEVLIAMRGALAVVVPSVWPEPFGLVALEAAALGRPVIASAHGGLTDIVVHGETGLLVVPGDALELEIAMRRLIGGRRLRAAMGAAASRHAASFSESAIVPQLETTYERLLTGETLTRRSSSGPFGPGPAVAPALVPVTAGEPYPGPGDHGAPAVAVEDDWHNGHGGSAATAVLDPPRLAMAAAPAAALDAAPRPKPVRQPRRPPIAIETEPSPSRQSWFPLLALACAVGLALVACADWLSRSGRPGGQAVLWGGLAMIFLPVVARLLTAGASRTERVASVVLLGAVLYLVKVLRDPFVFTYGDELLHQYNVQEILSTHALFGSNPVLPVTTAFPGLEAVTATLCSLTGLSTFTGGLIVAGVARLILMLAVFLLVERVTGSPRVGGLAAAIYAATPNFLFFISQFSYESLALPLAVLAIYAAVRGASRGAAPSWRWTLVAMLLSLAVVVTHHLTSYALVAFLALTCLVPMRPWGRRPWLVAIVSAAAAAAWLLFVAHRATGYLWPIIDKAFSATFDTVVGTAATRQLFQSSSGVSSPSWEHVVGIAASVLIIVAVSVGLVLMWRRHRGTPAGIVLAVAGAGYVASLGLRLVPSAWETGARASEFLFIGAAMLFALAAFWAMARSSRGRRALAAVAVCAAAAVLFAGGVIGGSSPDRRIAQTYRVSVDGGTLDPPAAALATWMGQHLPAGIGVAANDATALRILVDRGGAVRILTGIDPPVSRTDPPVHAVLATPEVLTWQMNLLDGLRIGYAAMDRRQASTDVIAGFFFARPGATGELIDDAIRTKFERLGADRLWDSGDLRLDDLRGVDRGQTVP